jgi:hypothetical protein
VQSCGIGLQMVVLFFAIFSTLGHSWQFIVGKFIYVQSCIYLRIWLIKCTKYWSLWSCGLMRIFAAASLLRLQVRISSGARILVCLNVVRLLSGRDLCDELITRPEESYRLWCVVVCDLETTIISRPWPVLDRSAKGGEKCARYQTCFTVHSKVLKII